MLEKIIDENKPAGIFKTIKLGLLTGIAASMICIFGFAGFKYKIQDEIVKFTNDPARKFEVKKTFELTIAV